VVQYNQSREGKPLKNQKGIDTMYNCEKTVKMTNAKALEYVLENCEVPTDVAERVNAMLISLQKKASAPKKPSAKRTENEALAEIIYQYMEDNTYYSGVDFRKDVPEVAAYGTEMNPQRMTAIMRILVNENQTVTKVTEKGKTFYVKKNAEDVEGV
jgi:hypothetical protein